MFSGSLPTVETSVVYCRCSPPAVREEKLLTEWDLERTLEPNKHVKEVGKIHRQKTKQKNNNSVMLQYGDTILFFNEIIGYKFQHLVRWH